MLANGAGDYIFGQTTHQYGLTETNFIRSVEEELKIQDQRKPMVINGRITIIAAELQSYINKNWFQNLSVIKVAEMLSALGAKSIRVRGSKFKDQSRWALPFWR